MEDLLLGHFSQHVQRVVVKAASLEHVLVQHLNQNMVELNVMVLFSMNRNVNKLIAQVSILFKFNFVLNFVF